VKQCKNLYRKRCCRDVPDISKYKVHNIMEYFYVTYYCLYIYKLYIIISLFKEKNACFWLIHCNSLKRFFFSFSKNHNQHYYKFCPVFIVWMVHQGDYDVPGMWLRLGKKGIHTEFWWGNLLEINLDDREGDERITIT